jgi:hypothetical protein
VRRRRRRRRRGGAQRLLGEEPAEDVVAVDHDEELVVEDGEDVLDVDVRQRVEQAHRAAADDQPRLLRLEEVAANLEDRRQHREEAEADRVAHRVREELRDVGEVDANRRARVGERLQREREPDERRAHDELVDGAQRLVRPRHKKLPAEVAAVERLDRPVDKAAHARAHPTQHRRRRRRLHHGQRQRRSPHAAQVQGSSGVDGGRGSGGGGGGRSRRRRQRGRVQRRGAAAQAAARGDGDERADED